MANKRISDLPEVTSSTVGDFVAIDGTTTRKITVENLLDDNLVAIKGLSSAANKGIQFTGAGTAATYDLTAAGKALLDDADAAAQRTTLGLGNVDNTSDATKNSAIATLTNKTISGANNTLTVREADLSTSDVTTGNVSTSKHGFAPKLPNDATRYLDGTGSYSVPAGSSVGYPPGHIYGLTLSNNVTTPNTVLDIASGTARDIGDAQNMALVSGISKSLASNWAVGTGNGGLDTGAKANSTWYHVWLIRRSDTGVVDVLFSTSATSPTMPASYNAKRRIGAIFTDSSGNIKAFYQTPGTGEFRWRTTAAPRDINGVSYTGLTPTLASVSVPTGVKVKGIFLFNPGTGTGACSLTDPDAGVPPDNTYSQASAGNFNEIYSWTSSVGQVYVTTGATGTVNLWTKGWFDFRDAAF